MRKTKNLYHWDYSKKKKLPKVPERTRSRVRGFSIQKGMQTKRVDIKIVLLKM